MNMHNGDHNPSFHDSIVGSPVTVLEERQQLLAHHVRLVARKMNHALFVFGAQGGLGKSRTILNTLDEEGVEPILINSHITPLALFTTLFRYRAEETLFFDDCDAMYSSMPHLGLLRSALWGSPRTVTYGSSQLPDGLPSSFETTARFIFAANVMPRRNDAFKALLSRCDIFELSATNEEVIDLMRSVSIKGFQNLTTEDCRMVIDYIAENADDRQLSMRLLGPSLRKLLYARGENIDWQQMIKSQLRTLGRKNDATKRLDSRTKDLRLLQKAIQKHPDSVQQQEQAWRQVTGKSRASFYRNLKRYRDEN